MATYSSVLAWRISGTGKPGGLPDVYGVPQSRTRLKRLSSSSSSSRPLSWQICSLAVNVMLYTVSVLWFLCNLKVHLESCPSICTIPLFSGFFLYIYNWLLTIWIDVTRHNLIYLSWCLLYSESENFLLSSNFGAFWFLYFKIVSTSFPLFSPSGAQIIHISEILILLSHRSVRLCQFFSIFFSLKPDLITSINSTSGSLYLFSFNSILLISLSYVVAMTDTLFLSSRISISFF